MPPSKSKYWVFCFKLTKENISEVEELDKHPKWGYPQIYNFLRDSLVKKISKIYPGRRLFRG